ncbi:uncharacterized protein LOC143896945 [Temnothorax americanus]|uniref:uncharacterized protein LOC143896945 n=1 Tax=Temnothorax americanus TaxID=1964332 RepID=UPI0040686F5D
MEREGRMIVEAVEGIVEEKLRKMLREKKEEDRKKDERMEELEEKVRRLERKIERLEQRGGKRKREDSEESMAGKKKWWAGEGKRNEDDFRKRNIIIRVEKEKWEGKETNWEKVKELFAEGPEGEGEGKRGDSGGAERDWLTILVKLGDEEEKEAGFGGEEKGRELHRSQDTRG